MLDGILDVCIIKTQDPNLGEVVKALIVKGTKSAVNEETVRIHCRKYLADYKIPQQIAFRSSLLKTGSGKILRDTLQKEEDIKIKQGH